MNKYLMLSAAAAMTTGLAGTANAGGYSVHFIGANGTSFCDGYIGSASSPRAGFQTAIGEHFYEICQSLGYTWLRNIEVAGTKSKSNQLFGKAYYFSDDSLAMSLLDLGYGPTTAFAYAEEYILQSPIKAGSKWCLWETFGTSAFCANAGVLAAGQYVKANGKNKNVQTSLSAVSEILRKSLKRPANKS